MTTCRGILFRGLSVRVVRQKIHCILTRLMFLIAMTLMR